MASLLTIRLLGPVEIRIDEQVLVPLHSRKEHWLLALLLLRHPRALERDWLAGTLWPESAQTRALAYLRRTLTDLRQGLGPHAYRLGAPTWQTLSLDVTGAEVDLLGFDAALARGDATSLQIAVALYSGPLLEGCDEEWALAERRSREQSYLGALQQLAQAALRRGEPGGAVEYLRAAVAVDPLQESVQRALMQALADSGDCAAATLVYRDLRLLLHNELNVEPDLETSALYLQIRARAHRRAGAGVNAKPSALASAPTPLILSHLPRPLTQLVGRTNEVRQVQDLMARARLVTLTGTGGIGKTRLAIQVAREMEEEYAQGACFIDLSALAEASLVPTKMASALGISEQSGRSLIETLVEFLHDKQMLLVLDNCEHLLEACAQLADRLLGDCAHLRLLATSRQSLGLTGEGTYRVPSLALPPPEEFGRESNIEKESVSHLMEYAAIRLFVGLAGLSQPTFQATSHNMELLVQICHHLEGIPLAIELAAARMKTMSLKQIAERLDDRFRLLTEGSRTALPRQQTLRATLDWSYDLLSHSERLLLARLSVFTGGWTLEAAEAIAADKDEGGKLKAVPSSIHPSSFILHPFDVLELLTHLVDRSLVSVEQQDGEVRYRLLETVRQYARDRLVQSGESDAVRGRHRDYFLALAEEADPRLAGPKETVRLERLETEHDNLRTALEWCLEESRREKGRRGEAEQSDQSTIDNRQSTIDEAGLRMVRALRWFWSRHVHWSEGRQRASEALSQAEWSRTPAYGEALLTAGHLAINQGDYLAARPYLEESLAIAQEGQDKVFLSDALRCLGWLAFLTNDLTAARLYLEECLALEQELGDRQTRAAIVFRLGSIAEAEGDYPAARALYAEAHAIDVKFGQRGGGARACLGNVARIQGDYGEARALLSESLVNASELGDKALVVVSLEYLAWLAQAQGQWERGARLCGVAETWREAVNAPLAPVLRADFDHHLADLRQALGEKAFAAAWAEGHAMMLEQAIEYALEYLCDNGDN